MSNFKKYTVRDKISVSNFNMLSAYVDALANMRVVGGKFSINEGGAALSIDSNVRSRAYLVQLLEDLEKGGTLAPTTAKAKLYAAVNLNEEAPPDLLPIEDDYRWITITNRDDLLTAKTDDIILVVRVNFDTGMEWHPVPESIDINTTTGGSGAGDCQCGCYKGVTIPGATQCCRSHLGFNLTNPLHNTGRDDLVLQYALQDTWKTDTFPGPNRGTGKARNEYCWELKVNTTGVTYLTLITVKDTGAPKLCLRYGRKGFDCQCYNLLTNKPPYGLLNGIERASIMCDVCLIPQTTPPPQSWDAVCGGSVCRIDAKYLPVGWTYSQDGTFDGGVCNSTGWSGAFKYTGNFCCGALDHVTVQSIDVDVNALEGQPLFQTDNVGQWQSGFGSSPRAIDSTDCRRSGDLTAFSEGGYSVGQTNIKCSLDIPTSTFYTQTCTLYHAANVYLQCLGVSNGLCSVRLMFQLYTAPIDEGVDPCILNVGETGTYFIDLIDILPEDLPCAIAQTHRLDKLYPNQNFNANVSACNGRLTPDFTTPSIPDSITITPIGGGTTDCPNAGFVPPPPTTTGMCDDVCVTGGVPTDPTPTGHCCVGTMCLDFTKQAFCNSVGGRFDTSSADCQPDSCDAQILPCCMPDGRCIGGLKAVYCSVIGGTLGQGHSCGNACLGACCTAGGSCSLTTQAACNALSGSTFYPGEDCTGRVCLGSCCCDCVGVPDCCCIEANVTEGWCAGLSLVDCDGGAGTSHWVSGDTTCTTCSGSC